MLFIQILRRAIVSIFLHRRFVLLVAAPILVAQVVLTTVSQTVRAIPDLSTHSLLLHAAGIAALSILLLTTLAIGWHRSLLAPTQGPLTAQPRLRYVLWAAGPILLSILLAALASRGLKELAWSQTIERDGPVPFFWWRVSTFAHQYATSFFVTVFFLPLSLHLPGVALTGRAQIGRTLRFAARNLLPILALGLTLAVVDWQVNSRFDFWLFLIQIAYEDSPDMTHATYLWRHYSVVGLNVALSVPLYLVGLGMITELYRDFADRQSQTA